LYQYKLSCIFSTKITDTVKSVGERNIPWSQQVDEASYENLSSPANDDNSGSIKV